MNLENIMHSYDIFLELELKRYHDTIAELEAEMEGSDE